MYTMYAEQPSDPICYIHRFLHSNIPVYNFFLQKACMDFIMYVVDVDFMGKYREKIIK